MVLYFFITVDGRQEGYSSGISMPNLAQLMIGFRSCTSTEPRRRRINNFCFKKIRSEDLILKNRPSGGTHEKRWEFLVNN